jgi:colicin import membrane protein
VWVTIVKQFENQREDTLMNNIVKSVVFAAVVLFAGIAAMQVIYNNQDGSADITAVEPAAGDVVVTPTDDQAEAARDTIDANAEAAKDAVEAQADADKAAAEAAEEAATTPAAEDAAEAQKDAAEANEDAAKEAIDTEADAAKEKVDADEEAAEKAAE